MSSRAASIVSASALVSFLAIVSAGASLRSPWIVALAIGPIVVAWFWARRISPLSMNSHRSLYREMIERGVVAALKEEQARVRSQRPFILLLGIVTFAAIAYVLHLLSSL